MGNDVTWDELCAINSQKFPSHPPTKLSFVMIAMVGWIGGWSKQGVGWMGDHFRFACHESVT
ncbi:hypothetical protein SAMN06265222_111117 [Neorhodopirellula lusitana]|uniref:Uncharacterized protein n=1 Tax=Neorhodopirellula lusitana TaxID=445327 RepID=A0ABY1QE16_9BACT|nr:hypothetical protein SAMN06265222_111117 [Neorhodopirellula lusitana]